MDVRVTGPQDALPADIVSAWGARLRDRLTERYPGRFTVDWTEDKEAPARPRPALHQWLILRRGTAIHGCIGLVWDQEQPGLLRIRTEADALPRPEMRIHRLLDGVSGILGVAGFGSWVWFAVVDWRRIWNRVSTFASGYDATHATKLEVLWLLVGWALSPAVGIMIGGLVRAWIENLVAAWQRRRVQAFARRELDQALEAMVQETLKETALDPKVCLTLGQAHLGHPHPVHPNLVWAANGQYKPAEGFTWASEDSDSLAVVPQAE
jgi:hypothetical protein